MQLETAALAFAVPALLVLARPSFAAPTWRCEARMHGDGVCDCGCGSRDSDCSGSTFEMCERSGCPSGQVPWEHAPESCMSSACGDGWVDEAAGEVCDDGEALVGGGCGARCDTVNDGWSCGIRASKCARLPSDADTTSGDTGPSGDTSDRDPLPPETTTGDDAGAGPTATSGADGPVAGDEGGCTGGATAGTLLSLPVLLGCRRRWQVRAGPQAAPRD